MAKEGIQVTLLVLSVAVAVGCAVYISYTASRSSTSQKMVAETEKKIDACITCDLMNKFSPLIKALFRRDDEGEKTCCAAMSFEQWSALLNLALNKDQQKTVVNKTYDPDDFALMHTSARVPLISPVNSFEEFDRTEQSEMGVALSLDRMQFSMASGHARNVDVLPSGLRIVNSGLYYVFSSIRLNADSVSRCQDNETWSHSVVRSNQKDHSMKTIIRNLHSCTDTFIIDQKTSFAGGKFLLDMGDHLQVRVSGRGFVRFAEDSSFFGLVKMDGKE